MFNGEDKEFYRNIDLDELSKGDLLVNLKLVKGLAMWNKKFAKHPLAQDLDILSMGNGRIAWLLASWSYGNGWGSTPAAQEMSVLKLKDGQVAERLWKYSKRNGWGDTDVVCNYRDEIFNLFDRSKITLY